MQRDNAYTDPGLTVCLMQAAVLFRYPAEAGLHAVRIDQAGLHAVADQPGGDSS
jgi:hypothetical protein